MIKFMMDLQRTLRDQRGTLYEVPILIAYVLLSLTLIPSSSPWWLGPVKAAVFFGAVIGGLILLVMAAEKFEGIINLEPLRRALDSPSARLLRAALAYLAGIVGLGAAAAFVSIFLAPQLAADPAGQLQAMRVITALGAAGGVLMVLQIRRR